MGRAGGGAGSRAARIFQRPLVALLALVRDEVGFPVDVRLGLARRRAGRGLERADAAVPAQDGVVVAGGADRLRLGVARERLVEERSDRAEGYLRGELGLRLPLQREARVERALIGVREAAEDRFRLGEPALGRRSELVGEREAEDAERQLVSGVDRKHVATDALGLFGLVQLAVAIGLLQGGVDAVGVDALQS